MILMRCGALHLTFVGPLPAGASVPGPYLTEQSSLRGINQGAVRPKDHKERSRSTIRTGRVRKHTRLIRPPSTESLTHSDG